LRSRCSQNLHRSTVGGGHKDLDERGPPTDPQTAAFMNPPTIAEAPAPVEAVAA
jgi:hypothetical protein